MARSNDLGLPDAFIDWVEEIIDTHLNLSDSELRAHLLKATGEDFTESYIKRQRAFAHERRHRADLHPEP